MERRNFLKAIGGTALALSAPISLAGAFANKNTSPLTISGVYPGSRVYVEADGGQIYNHVVDGNGSTMMEVYEHVQHIMVRVRTNSPTYMKPLELNTTFGKKGIHLHIQQQPDLLFND